MNPTTPHSFLIADDHSIVRNGLAILIKSTFDDAFVYQAATFQEIQNHVSEIKTDFLILDISFPEGTTLRLLPGLKAVQPNMKILLFSSYDEEVYAPRYIKAGADGYLSKLSSPEEIQRALLILNQEGKYTSAVIKDKIVASFVSNTSLNPLDQLSRREFEIARLLVKGYGNLEISNEFNLKASTVSTYKTRIYEKLGITSLPSLIQKFGLYSDSI